MWENSSYDYDYDDDFFFFANSSHFLLGCYTSDLSIFILTAFSAANILLLLPLYVLILCLGCRRWRCSASAATHSDIFTYHMVAMEMMAVLDCVLYCVSAFVDLQAMMYHSARLFSTIWCLKIQFHTLTCVERYLAIVHPITYLGLKDGGGVKIRNVSIGCVWLLCVAGMVSVPLVSDHVVMILYFCFVSFTLIAVTYCGVSVLCALRRPAPGEVGGNREGGDQLKQRAFHTVVTIMVVLWLCLTGMLVCDALEVSEVLSVSDSCVALTSSVWFSLPSSLVLPLLFLHKEGKLPFCRR